MRISDMVQMQMENLAKQSLQNRTTKSTNGQVVRHGDFVYPPGIDPDRDITISTAHRKIVPVSDEVKNKLVELTKKAFIEGNGMSDGEEKMKVINSYLETIPSKERSAAAWTLGQFSLETAKQFREKIQEVESNWNYGQSFDTSVLDNFPPKHIDIKA